MPSAIRRSWRAARSRIAASSALRRVVDLEQVHDGAEHRRDHQVGGHLQVVGRPVEAGGEPGQVDGELAGEQRQLGLDRAAHAAHPAVALAAEEAELVGMLAHLLAEDLDGALDDVAVAGHAAAGVADHLPQRPHALVDEFDAERVHRLEVPVERGGDDAGVAGHLAQADAGQAAVGDQLQGDVEQALAGGFLALGAAG